METWRTLTGALWLRADWHHPVRRAMEILRSTHFGIRYRREIGAWEVAAAVVPHLVERLRADGFQDAAEAIPPWSADDALARLGGAVVLDIEATALHGGAPILIGIRDSRGQVRQWFITPENEHLVAEALLTQILPRASAVVTFGGDTFHLPLLQQMAERMEIGRSVPWERSIDLAQRAHVLREAGELPNARLRTVERYYGIQRQPTIPSAAIPALYERAVSGDRAAQTQILRVNRADLDAIARLAVPLLRGDPSPVPDIRALLDRVDAAERLLRARREYEEARAALLALAPAGTRIATEVGWVEVTAEGTLVEVPAPEGESVDDAATA